MRHDRDPLALRVLGVGLLSGGGRQVWRYQDQVSTVAQRLHPALRGLDREDRLRPGAQPAAAGAGQNDDVGIRNGGGARCLPTAQGRSRTQYHQIEGPVLSRRGAEGKDGPSRIEAVGVARGRLETRQPRAMLHARLLLGELTIEESPLAVQDATGSG